MNQRDRLLASLAGFIGFASLWDFAHWIAPHVMTGLAVFAAILPLAVAEPTGSMNPTIDGGDRLIHDAGLGDVEKDDVIVFAGGENGTEYVHRTVFWVEKGENWYDEANKSYVGDAENCEELRYCPAPHSGWVTKGDANPRYDQAAGRSPPVRPEWVKGTVVVVVEPENWSITRISA